MSYGIDDPIVDAKGIVGRARSGGWRAVVLIAVLGGAGCGQNVNLGDIVLWKATFETGNLSEWTADGQGSPYNDNDPPQDAPAATPVRAHHGTTSAVFGVAPSAAGTAISYLTRDQPTPVQAYYSAWFYVPSPLVLATGQYLSLVHFRGSDGQALAALWDVNLTPVGDGTVAAQLYDYPAQNKIALDLQQSPVTRFPLDRWVQLEVFLSQAVDATGHITIWQDGAQILDRANVPTVIVMGSLQWDVGGASDGLTSGSALVYVDDAAISPVRLGPDTTL